MENFKGESISFWQWLVCSILSGVIAPTIVVFLAWIDIGYSSPDVISDGFIRAVGALIMTLPIFMFFHILFFLIVNYFIDLPEKIIEVRRILKMLAMLYICYLISWGLFIFSTNTIERVNFEIVMILFVPFLVMVIPLTLVIILSNIMLLYLFKIRNKLG